MGLVPDPRLPETPPVGPPPMTPLGAGCLRGSLAVVETSGALLFAAIASFFAFEVVWIAYQIGIGGHALAELLESAVAAPGQSLLIPDPENPSAPAVVALLGTQAVCFVAVAWVMLRLRIRPEPRLRRSHPAVAIVLGVAVGGVALLLASVATRFLDWLGVDVTEQAWLVSLASDEPDVLWNLAPWLVLIAPFAEEVFFRGYVFRFLTERGGPVLGAVVSSLLFGLVHFHPPLLMVYFVYGILFAGLYRRTGRLLAPVTAHVTVNLVGVILLGMSVG